jgi:hypothetical protein
MSHEKQRSIYFSSPSGVHVAHPTEPDVALCGAAGGDLVQTKWTLITCPICTAMVHQARRVRTLATPEQMAAEWEPPKPLCNFGACPTGCGGRFRNVSDGRYFCDTCGSSIQ